MDLLIDDVIICIAKFLNNKEKIIFLSLSMKLHKLKNNIYYDDYVCLHKIYDLPYYNMFTHVIFNKLGYNLPNSITHLFFEYLISNKRGILIKDNVKIPVTVTHLSFNSMFNQDITDFIPRSVTHLTFGNNFNKNIKDLNIDESVEIYFMEKNEIYQYIHNSDKLNKCEKTKYSQYIICLFELMQNDMKYLYYCEWFKSSKS